MKTILSIYVVTIFFYGCQQNTKSTSKVEVQNKGEVKSISAVSNRDSIVNLVKTKGDTLAYYELFYFLMDSNESDRTDTLMYYSKIMAEKYEYKVAYIHYLKGFAEKHKTGSWNMDEDYSKFDISHLTEAEKKEIGDWLKKMLAKKIINKEQYNSIKI